METAGREFETGGAVRFRQARSITIWQPRRKAPDAAKSASSTCVACTTAGSMGR